MRFPGWLALGLSAACVQAATPRVRVLEDPTRIEVSVAAASADPDESLLTMSVLREDGTAGAPMFGSYQRQDSTLTFRPRFPLIAGSRYRITSGPDHLDYEVPTMAPQAAATVEQIHPACRDVPANLLKFYLHFTRPMREGREVFTHIHLVDSAGKQVEAPWRDTELWTEDGRRLTLWIHPGRVKRGVNLREELGPVLRPNEAYTLIVDADLRDAAGQVLGKEFRHIFQTTDELNRRLDLTKWEFKAPKIGSREPFRAIAPVALDHALALRCIHLVSATGPITGTALLGDDARTWSFTPDQPWTTSSVVVAADPWLEDLAGNTFRRVFDDDTTVAHEAGPAQVSREFTPHP